jgi:hypothetical protein
MRVERDQPSEHLPTNDRDETEQMGRTHIARTTTTTLSLIMPELPRHKPEQDSNACTPTIKYYSLQSKSQDPMRIRCLCCLVRKRLVKSSRLDRSNFVSYTTLPFHSPPFIKDSAFCLLLHILVVASPAQAANC